MMEYMEKELQSEEAEVYHVFLLRVYYVLLRTWTVVGHPQG